MHDPSKLPVELWAVKKNGRTRIMVQVEGDEPLELLSWADGYDKLGITSDPLKVHDDIERRPGCTDHENGPSEPARDR